LASHGLTFADVLDERHAAEADWQAIPHAHRM
jgi:hypothetical protein